MSDPVRRWPRDPCAPGPALFTLRRLGRMFGQALNGQQFSLAQQALRQAAEQDAKRRKQAELDSDKEWRVARLGFEDPIPRVGQEWADPRFYSDVNSGRAIPLKSSEHIEFTLLDLRPECGEPFQISVWTVRCSRPAAHRSKTHRGKVGRADGVILTVKWPVEGMMEEERFSYARALEVAESGRPQSKKK